MLRKLPSLLGLSLLLSLCVTHPLLAQPTSSPGSQGGSGEQPPSTVGGGTREVDHEIITCAAVPEDAPESTPSLTVLVIENQLISAQQSQGNLYVYIPPETNRLAVLEVMEVNTQTAVFEAEVELNSADAIARLVIPDTVSLSTATNSDRSYEWTLSVYCDPSSDVAIAIEGTIFPSEPGNGLEPIDSTATDLQVWQEYLDAWSSEQANTVIIWPEQLTTEAIDALAPYGDRPVETYVLTNLLSPSAVGDP